MVTRPNKSEEQFLNLGYNRFYDLYDEIFNDDFWGKSSSHRFSRVSQVFAIYSELLTYEPFNHVLEALKQQRPPMESEIGGPLLKFVRNILSHFPIFDSWNEVWINKSLVNWQRDGLSIDKFLKKYAGHGEIKYRFWEPEKKSMTYLSIQFPEKYDDDPIFLKDIITEKDGVKFSLIMMRQILQTQVESVVEGT